MLEIIRDKHNPILKPDPNYSWQSLAVFNGCPIKVGKKIDLLFRAFSAPQYNVLSGARMSISTIGYAESADGAHFEKRRSLLTPKYEWERFGCEDPRVTKIGNNYYIFYTALSNYPFNADGIKVAVAITKDFKEISERHLVTPFNAKAMALFPGKVNGKLAAILSADTDRPPVKMGIIYFDNVKQIWSKSHWEKWYKKVEKNSLDLKREFDDHVEVGAPPIKTKYGWLLIYSHINHYGRHDVLFGIEAVLLDINNPLKIIGRTRHPLIIPEDYDELYGMVPNVIFPSGALLEGDELTVYYGSADTTCSKFSLNFSDLIRHMQAPYTCKQFSFSRVGKAPIMRPRSKNPWEAKAVLNPAAFYADGKVHIVYRAMSNDDTSVFGYAVSKDGETISERLNEPIYVPREDFENKKNKGNSGCEDPRITVIKDTVYMCYTAFDGKHNPRVALTSIPLKKFLNRVWDWKKPVLISAPGIDDKDAAIFPEKVNGKYLIFHRIGDDIDIASVDSLDFDGKTWIEERRWLKQRREHWDNRKIGISSPPFKTEKGWVLLYHGVSKNNSIYRVGAVLLDLKNPTKIIGRTEDVLFEPVTKYEREGIVPNVVFPCGSVVIKNTVYIYYGGADKVIGVAKMTINDLLNAFD